MVLRGTTTAALDIYTVKINFFSSETASSIRRVKSRCLDACTTENTKLKGVSSFGRTEALSERV